MEFGNVGLHCSEKSCKQLDFLPFQCVQCKQTFCLDHRSFKAHNCPVSFSAEVPQCPVCDALITVKKGEDVNAVMDRHISAGCPASDVAKSFAVPCSLKKCRESEVAPIRCTKCNKPFCVRHRFPEDHECERLPVRTPSPAPPSRVGEAVAAVSRQVSDKIGQMVKQHGPLKGAARVVQLNRMRSQAKGPSTVPPEKRFYLEAIYPADSNVAPRLLFFSRDWTVGKALDAVASAGGIENRNNDSRAPKLHLISLKNGLPLENSLKLEDMAEILQSGDSVLLDRLE